MTAFITAHRDQYGVEPICRVLPIAPSTYYARIATQTDPTKLSDRVRRDQALRPVIRRVFADNYGVYGVRKIWQQMRREGYDIARCTVARLMRDMGLRGVIRGKSQRTTVSNKTDVCPLDLVNRQFKAPAPNVLWVSDFTYVSTWSGFVYVAFVIDVFARRIVGWRVSRTAHTDFVLDALEQALHQRRPQGSGSLVHHSDRGSQYVSIKYTDFIKLKSFIDQGRGSPLTPSSSRPSNGSTGSTTAGFLALSATSRRQSLKQTITPIWANVPWPRN